MACVKCVIGSQGVNSRFYFLKKVFELRIKNIKKKKISVVTQRIDIELNCGTAKFTTTHKKRLQPSEMLPEVSN